MPKEPGGKTSDQRRHHPYLKGSVSLSLPEPRTSVFDFDNKKYASSLPANHKITVDPREVFELVDGIENPKLHGYEEDESQELLSQLSNDGYNATFDVPFTGDETLNIDYFLTFVDQVKTYVEGLGQPRTYDPTGEQSINVTKPQGQKQGIMKKYNIMYENMRQYFVHVMDKIIGNSVHKEGVISNLMNLAMIKLQDAIRTYVKNDPLLKKIYTISRLNIGSETDNFNDPGQQLTLRFLFENENIQHISILTLRAMMQGLFDLYNEQMGRDTHHKTTGEDNASMDSGMITVAGEDMITPDASATIFLKIMMPKFEIAMSEIEMKGQYRAYGEYFKQIMKKMKDYERLPQRKDQMISYLNFEEFTATNKNNFVNNTNNFAGHDNRVVQRNPPFSLRLEILLTLYNHRFGMQNNDNETYHARGGKKRKTKRRMKKKSEKSRVKKHTKSKRKSSRRKAKK